MMSEVEEAEEEEVEEEEEEPHALKEQYHEGHYTGIARRPNSDPEPNPEPEPEPHPNPDVHLGRTRQLEALPLESTHLHERHDLAHDLAPARDARETPLAHAVRDAHGLGGDIERAAHEAPRAPARAEPELAPDSGSGSEDSCAGEGEGEGEGSC